MNENPYENLVQHLFPATSRGPLEPLRDQHLLRRYTSRHDELALGEVIRRHGAMVWTVCRRMVERRQDAEDMYQVTFLRLVRRAAFVQRRQSIESWLHAVARDAASHVQRKCDRWGACENRRAQMFEEGYTDPQDSEDLADILDEEVGYLPEKCRSPMILCYLEGLTPEQAARRINISVSCLKRRLVEGRKRLHQRLSQRGIHLDSPMLMEELTTDLYPEQVPPGLTEKTLDIVRILTQSNSALGTECISGGALMLAHRAWQSWTLKAKLLLGFLLVILVLTGGGLITYSGWMSTREEQLQEETPSSTKKVGQMPEINETPLSHTDDHSLPPLGAALHRARRGSPDPAARRPQVSPSSYKPERTPSWNDTAFCALGAGLLTPPLDDRRSPLPATGRKGCLHGTIPLSLEWETFGRHSGGVGRPAPSGAAS